MKQTSENEDKRKRWWRLFVEWAAVITFIIGLFSCFGIQTVEDFFKTPFASPVPQNPKAIGAQTTLPDPCVASTVSSKYLNGGGLSAMTIGLHACTIQTRDLIVCSFILTSQKEGSTDFTYDPQFWDSTLIDNNNDPHKQTRGYFLNRRNEQLSHITLPQNHCEWFNQEFSGRTDDNISHADIAFRLKGYNPVTFTIGADVEWTIRGPADKSP